jgi:prepilin-type N-terminal cleavage/methylation domain-containing protein
MKKLRTGFTLVELLVSVGLFAAISTIVISVLFTAFRASKKSEVMLAVKQNGSTALSRMVNNIRFARSLDDPLVCIPDALLDSITVTAFDGGQTVYGCPGVLTESISSNSAVLVDINAVSVTACSFTCSQTSVSDPPTITIQFILSAARATDFVETTSSIPFQTAVTMRNFYR